MVVIMLLAFNWLKIGKDFNINQWNIESAIKNKIRFALACYMLILMTDPIAEETVTQVKICT